MADPVIVGSVRLMITRDDKTEPHAACGFAITEGMSEEKFRQLMHALSNTATNINCTPGYWEKLNGE